MPAFVLGEELADLADRDERIVVATADLANSSRTRDVAARHPSRFIDFGIAERKTIGFVRTWPGGTLNRHILLTTSRLSPRRRAGAQRLARCGPQVLAAP